LNNAAQWFAVQELHIAIPVLVLIQQQVKTFAFENRGDVEDNFNGLL
jgi:hypothetical protein